MNAAPARLFVCGSCGVEPAARRDALRSEFAAAVAAALAGGGVEMREVACLNGCLRPCNAALRGPARATFRFSSLTHEDVPALVSFAAEYWTARPGTECRARMPAALQQRLATVTPPPAPLRGAVHRQRRAAQR